MAGTKLSREERNSLTKQRNAARREEAQKVANIRNEKWAKLSPKEQLAELDRRLGKGVGAKRQRTKLAKLIS